MGCEGEVKPAAETIDPDNRIISRYLSSSCVHIKHLHTLWDRPEGLGHPLTPLERRENANGRTILESQGHFLSLSCA